MIRYPRRGFTLLELLISLGVLALLGTLGMVSFLNSRNSRDLVVTSQNALSVLRDAQARTLAGEDASVWGVHLEQSQVVLFRGATYAGATSTDPHPLSANIEIVNIALVGGGSDVLFRRLDGTTTQSGTFDVRVRGSATMVNRITIDASGKVYEAGTAPAASGTRLVDTRHRSFNLGWSIRGSVSLIFTFSDPPNPDLVYSVVMAPYFNADQTKFDWSGSVLVGGQPQTMRIHTTSLTGSNTVLSVDRDCRFNTKKVRITIDIRDIATYEANCTTVTVGPYGGTVSEP